ncbi:MAG: hypothetical protein AB2L24_22195 [Mangrovibacterium sp.]
MFSDEEKKDIFQHLPEGCYFQSYNSDEIRGINSMIVGDYPVKGLFNPMEIIRNINSINNEKAKTVFINFRSFYDRDYEHFGAIEKFMDLLTGYLDNPVEPGTMTEEKQLFQLCRDWGGDENADLLYRAFTALEQAEQYGNIALSGASAIYWGVTERHITRPLVIAPHLLSAEEESYFMPFVFNPSEEEARMDYTDIHGAHRTLPSGAADNYVSRINRVIGLLEKAVENVPDKAFFQNLVTVLKIHSSIFRSIGNFAEAQAIRDR